MSLRIRRWQPEDIDTSSGLLQTLQGLGPVDKLTTDHLVNLWAKMEAKQSYKVFVVVDDEIKEIIAVATLLLEQKIIHNGGVVGHIEDVVVRDGCRTKGIGTELVYLLIEEAKRDGCYKVVLNCKAELVKFYHHTGFRIHDVGMRLDLKPFD